MQNLYWGAEAIYQSPILIAKRSKGSFSLIQYAKNGIRGIQEFELHSRGMVSEIYSGLRGVVLQRFGD
jgi:hypothetical protein